jgi:hypothetical protein
VAAIVVSAIVIAPRLGAQAAGQSGQRSASQAAAMPTTPRAWYAVNVVTVKRETAAEWREFQRTQTIPMQQKGGVRLRDTWQSGAPFGEGLTYAIVTAIDKFEDYDKPPLVSRVLSGDALRAFQEKNNQLVASNHTYALQDRAELSIAPNATMKPVGAILTEVTVVSGHADQYEAYIKNDLLPVLKKANVPGFVVTRTVFGGNANEYHTVQYLESFAEIDKGPATLRVLGAAGQQALIAKSTPHIASVNRNLLRYVPDLSFRARPAS